MQTLYIIKIGGNIIDDNIKLDAFLHDFALIPEKKILVHGGGKLATELAGRLGIEQTLIDGRRITDAETLKIVTMVYGGYINKRIVAGLQASGANAFGLTGADGNLIKAHKRTRGTIDYGFAGDVDLINTTLIDALLQQGLCLVIAPITHNGQGQLLNTNADTIAQELARSLTHQYNVHLIYSFEKSGVLLDANDNGTVISRLTRDYYQELRNEQKIFAGMIPKIDNAFAALDSGVKQVTIGKAEELTQLIAHTAGTNISHE